MRHLLVLVLLPAVLVQGCASTANSRRAAAPVRPADQATAADAAKLQAISEELAGEAATVELAGGEVVQKARSVRLGTQVTSWYDSASHERTVPTAEVRRVLRDQRHLIGRGFGYGATAAVLPAYWVATSHSNDSGYFAGAGAFLGGLLTVVGGGLIGMLVAAGNRHAVVVYEGPPSPRAAASGTAAELHCHLAPAAAGGDRLDCVPGLR